MTQAEIDARDVWENEGYYRIGWSDGGTDWTSDGPVWFETVEDLADELACAQENETGTHLAWVGKVRQFQQYELDALLGDSADDFDVDAIIADATRACHDGNRYWVAEGDELNAIIAANEK